MAIDIKLITSGYGWKQIPSGNSYSYSFTLEDYRLNIYFTTNTIVCQCPHKTLTYKRVQPEHLENILIEIDSVIYA